MSKMTSRNPIVRLLHATQPLAQDESSVGMAPQSDNEVDFVDSETAPADQTDSATDGTNNLRNGSTSVSGHSRSSTIAVMESSSPLSTSPSTGLAPIITSNGHSRARAGTTPVVLSPREPSNITVVNDSLSIEFDGSSHVIVRPNRIIRGMVTMILTERAYCSRIRIKFRAEECAVIQIEEGSGENKGMRIHQMTTTFFETDFKLWGCDRSNYQLATWDELEPGEYTFPFALKFPNVNFPPSIEEPSGFSIRYIWTAIVDGPGLTSGLRSKDHITPYRPIIVAPPDKEWVFRASLKKEGKEQNRNATVLAEAQAKLPRQAVCPDEPFSLLLTISPVHLDLRITQITYRLRKHHEGRILLQRGTAFREAIRTPVHETIYIENPRAGEPLSQQISFTMPTRLVSPSFSSRHTRVHYDLAFTVIFESTALMFKTSSTAEFHVPLAVANLPNDHLLRIPELTAIADYRTNRDSPFFFPPELDEPPPPDQFPSELIGPLTASLMSPPQGSPPSYFSLPQLPSTTTSARQRVEKVIYTTRVPRSGSSGDLGDPVLAKGLSDEEW